MDDTFAEDELPKLLRFMRDAMRAFEQDHKLVMSPAKCKLHMKGVSIDTAHDLVKQCIEAGAEWHPSNADAVHLDDVLGGVLVSHQEGAQTFHVVVRINALPEKIVSGIDADSFHVQFAFAWRQV